jgi:hypothetical protein
MSNQGFSGPDAARSRLRAAVARVEHELSRLPKQGTDNSGSPRGDLVAAFAVLVKQLALGPEPSVRECPVCHHIGMRTAILCGYCWTKLALPTGDDGDGERSIPASTPFGPSSASTTCSR